MSLQINHMLNTMQTQNACSRDIQGAQYCESGDGNLMLSSFWRGAEGNVMFLNAINKECYVMVNNFPSLP